jgi:hypothetical protein
MVGSSLIFIVGTFLLGDRFSKKSKPGTPLLIPVDFCKHGDSSSSDADPDKDERASDSGGSATVN